ncbi:MAG: chorismate synthase [bacterium]|nr:chorismate synthase [bacterium]
MASNSFGKIFRFTTWGESHGPAIGVVIDGVPPNFKLDLEFIQSELERRRPGSSKLTTARKEKDKFELLSGFFEGRTTGAPLSFIIRNENKRGKDYEILTNLYRPGHADYTYHKKYKNYDPYGGGRSSARETAGRVIAGAIAKQYLAVSGTSVEANLIQVGETRGELNVLQAEILKVKQKGNSIGGVIEVVANGVPVGWGEPTYEKLDARLAYALMGLNAVKAVEIGDGINVVGRFGSENNDELTPEGFKSNSSGGVLGGISTGQQVVARVHIKPTASIFKPQKTIDREGHPHVLDLRGRHDPCVALRAVVIVEAIVASVLFDLSLLANALSPIDE